MGVQLQTCMYLDNVRPQYRLCAACHGAFRATAKLMSFPTPRHVNLGAKRTISGSQHEI